MELEMSIIGPLFCFDGKEKDKVAIFVNLMLLMEKITFIRRDLQI